MPSIYLIQKALYYMVNEWNEEIANEEDFSASWQIRKDKLTYGSPTLDLRQLFYKDKVHTNARIGQQGEDWNLFKTDYRFNLFKTIIL